MNMYTTVASIVSDGVLGQVPYNSLLTNGGGGGGRGRTCSEVAQAAFEDPDPADLMVELGYQNVCVQCVCMPICDQKCVNVRT